jgi:hypothetical protein
MRRWLPYLAVVLVALGFSWHATDQRRDFCRDVQGLHDAVHRVIAETGRPSPTGSALSRLTIPEGTPPQVVDILNQLQAQPDRAQVERDLERFYDELEPRPEC